MTIPWLRVETLGITKWTTAWLDMSVLEDHQLKIDVPDKYWREPTTEEGESNMPNPAKPCANKRNTLTTKTCQPMPAPRNITKTMITLKRNQKCASVVPIAHKCAHNIMKSAEALRLEA